jgi:hypothetical protein
LYDVDTGHALYFELALASVRKDGEALSYVDDTHEH